ncbi:MAG: CsgG/HfaB family protein [Calditrichaceae bacterium]
MKKWIIFSVFTLLLVNMAVAGDEWFRVYEEGVNSVKIGDYDTAILKFQQALKDQPVDKRKIRTYGMHFIQYFPHRELGIAYFNLGRMEEAKRHLAVSMKQEPSKRALEYLNKIRGGDQPETPVQKDPEPVVSKVVPPVISPVPSRTPEMIVGKKTVKLVGERMGVAVWPFENKGASKDLGEIVLDKMITALFNQGRFRVIERAQLEKILDEQQLGMAGVIDASTAAEIGKGIGVDAIIIGSVAAAPSGAISLDARAIDTESATIIIAHDAYSGSSDAQSVKNTVENLANKFTESLPLVEGYIIRQDENGIMLDVGRTGGIKKGMKCVVYKEGAEVKHPITGEVLGKETKIVAEILVTDSFEKYSSARIIQNEPGQIVAIGDKFLTK